MNKNIDDVINKTITSWFNISNVIDFEDIAASYSKDDIVYRKCLYWIATIYFHNQKHEESIQVYRELLKHGEKMPNELSTIVINTITQLTNLKKLNEAESLYKEYIEKEQLSSFNIRIFLLKWFVDTCDPDEPNLEKYRDIVNVVMEEIGYISEKTNLKDKIIDIYSINKVAEKEYGEFSISYSEKTNDEKKIAIQKILNSNLPGYYKMLAKNLL